MRGQKRKNEPEADPFLDALQQRICGEVAVLRALEQDIDEADTDTEAPVDPSSITAAAGGNDEPAMAPPTGARMRGPAGGGLAPGAAAHTGQYVTGTEAEAAFGLRARAKRERDRRRKARKRDAGSFSLAAVNERMAAFVVEGGAGAATDALELPSFSKLQRMQVRALACLYGLEARACGRAGQTLFRTGKCGPPTDEGSAQVERLLACSVSHGKPTAELKQQMDAALCASRASLRRPIPGSNRGAVMLQRLGWAAGSGLGAQGQGRTEPVPLRLGQRRQGLGS